MEKSKRNDGEHFNIAFHGYFGLIFVYLEGKKEISSEFTYSFHFGLAEQ